jgi:hypothetical protein
MVHNDEIDLFRDGISIFGVFLVKGCDDGSLSQSLDVHVCDIICFRLMERHGKISSFITPIVADRYT